jgi:hypothetical protein
MRVRMRGGRPDPAAYAWGFPADPTIVWVVGGLGSLREFGEQVVRGSTLSHHEPGDRRQAAFGTHLHPFA